MPKRKRHVRVSVRPSAFFFFCKLSNLFIVLWYKACCGTETCHTNRVPRSSGANYRYKVWYVQQHMLKSTYVRVFCRHFCNCKNRADLRGGGPFAYKVLRMSLTSMYFEVWYIHTYICTSTAYDMYVDKHCTTLTYHMICTMYVHTIHLVVRASRSNPSVPCVGPLAQQYTRYAIDMLLYFCHVTYTGVYDTVCTYILRSTMTYHVIRRVDDCWTYHTILDMRGSFNKQSFVHPLLCCSGLHSRYWILICGLHLTLNTQHITPRCWFCFLKNYLPPLTQTFIHKPQEQVLTRTYSSSQCYDMIAFRLVLRGNEQTEQLQRVTYSVVYLI